MVACFKNMANEKSRRIRMKIEEAKSKSCCISVNKEACIADKCMAWRWNREPKPPKGIRQGIWPNLISKTNGYCGLAGKEKPERTEFGME
jgi:hypothetical protein